ncbi:hypothetical protein TNCV_2050761 [Trichonephila clavipes]|nr:hypothetical protein TNCV_2050761 [Trichonephila clavipes]
MPENLMHVRAFIEQYPYHLNMHLPWDCLIGVDTQRRQCTNVAHIPERTKGSNYSGSGCRFTGNHTKTYEQLVMFLPLEVHLSKYQREREV